MKYLFHLMLKLSKNYMEQRNGHYRLIKSRVRPLKIILLFHISDMKIQTIRPLFIEKKTCC